MDALIRFTEKGGYYIDNKFKNFKLYEDIKYFFLEVVPKQDNYFYNGSKINQIQKDDIFYFSYNGKIVAVAQYTGNNKERKKKFYYGYQIKNIKLLDEISIDNNLFKGRSLSYIKTDEQREELNKIPYIIDNIEEIRIKSLNMENFTLFNNACLEFSKGINILVGENGTGKSQILKLLYSILKTNNENRRFEISIINELEQVFRPNDKKVSKLISFGEDKSSIDIDLLAYKIGFNFTKTTKYEVNINHIPQKFYQKETILIPAKEILSHFKGFIGTYNRREIAFDKTTYDLAIGLDTPLLKEQKLIKEKNRELEEILRGEIIQLNGEFYLRRFKDRELVVSSMMAEGLRKIGTISYLLKNGTLNRNTILFWDEPEANLNPKLIKNIVNLLIFLEGLGVQIFIATHNYFMIKYFDILKKEKENMDLKFISIYKKESQVKIETSTDIYDLEHNAIIDEMENIYLKSSKLFYKGKE